MSLGIPDIGVWLAYVLSVMSALLCLVWGLARWNSDAPAGSAPENAVRDWADEEDKLEEEL